MLQVTKLEKFDWLMFVTICLLLTIGFFFVWSASSERFAYRQIIWIGIGMGVFFGLLIFDYYSIAKYSYIFYTIIIFILFLVFFFGKTVYGAKRWLALGPVSIQPSEFMKIVLVMVLARHFALKRKISRFSDIAFPLFLTVLPMALIIKQPDLGTSLVLLPIFFSILYIAGTKFKYIFSIIVFGLISIPFFWYFLFKGYQKDRVIGFLWPNAADELGTGYHRIQSLIAVGSGGWFGSGWGNGIQSQLNFLPQGHTDFIFSVIAEEWGFFRSCAVLALYLIFIACSIGIAFSTRELYGKLIITGFTAMFTTQILINVAMSIGLVPITGLTLPFISYGGSSLLSSFVALSFMFNVRLRTRVVMAKDEFYE